MLRRSLSYLMKGKEMTNHQHGRKDSHKSLTAHCSMAMEATIRRLMATTTLTVSMATSDSPEGLWSATCTAQPSQGKFADAGCLTNCKAPQSPDGNFAVKRPAFLEGLFEKSFCSTKQVPLFLSSQKFLGLLAGSQTVPFFITVIILSLSLKTH